MATVEERLNRLEAIDEIKELTARYCWHVMRGEGAATLRAAMAQPSAPTMGAANTRSPAMYSESEIAYPAVRTAPRCSSISSSVTGVCSLTFTRRLKPTMRRISARGRNAKMLWPIAVQ